MALYLVWTAIFFLSVVMFPNFTYIALSVICLQLVTFVDFQFDQESDFQFASYQFFVLGVVGLSSHFATFFFQSGKSMSPVILVINLGV